ncbi:hypothetical protein B9Z55_015497 [Caenorhabditis nigoni]|uniref:F-box domain-containing protein n=1 Tax=Caenorhabditis nigoni TaxID=1611254 RepID=A0A2G5UAJ4_9PELO|nr:hypothetical protein B9Z55_015495 [Caenorhabditis nigoni]PIC36549.1 hypothetical protein B9Z55_015496 [Caenorhabditis nigoni]PIC36550.1 hypothetical protein B9Z55_015497 [Caenorhabditis nigoni]
MDETPKNRKFGLLKFPFALREEVIRNMEFMDAFHFSTLSKRSKRLVHDAKLRAHSISFRFGFLEKDKIGVVTKNGNFVIELPGPNDIGTKILPNLLDGRKLANLINEPSDDYRKRLIAHLLFIFHFKETKLLIEGCFVDPLTEFFLWDVRKTFDFVSFGRCISILISSEDLKFILETIKSKGCYLGIKIDDANFKYRKALECDTFSAFGSVQWLDTDGILQRNPKMKKLYLEGLEGKQINDLLKQWINRQVTDLESLRVRKRYGSRDPADVILDGILTMDPTITHQQAKRVYSRQEIKGQLMNIQRKVDGQLATVLLDEKECSVIVWNEKRLAELGN